jgi:hypothetical protein
VCRARCACHAQRMPCDAPCKRAVQHRAVRRAMQRAAHGAAYTAACCRLASCRALGFGFG